MELIDKILQYISLVGIIFGIFAIGLLLTYKKKRAYIESMKQELLKITEDALPEHVQVKYQTEAIPEDLKKFLDEKKEVIEDLLTKLKKSEYWADAEIYFRLGIYYYIQKSYHLAIDSFKKALHFNQNQKMIYFNMGLIHIVLENWELAIECFNESIKRGEEKTNSYYNLGWVYDEIKNYEEAVKCYEQSLNVTYDSIYNKACTFAKWDKDDEAIRELEKIADREDFRELMLIDDDLENLRKQGKIESLLKRYSSQKD